MTLMLFDATGVVGSVATHKGYDDVDKTVRRFKSAGPLVDLLTDGETTDMEGVIKEIEEILPRVTDANVKNTLTGLKTKLAKAEEIAIVSDN